MRQDQTETKYFLPLIFIWFYEQSNVASNIVIYPLHLIMPGVTMVPKLVTTKLIPYGFAVMILLVGNPARCCGISKYNIFMSIVIQEKIINMETTTLFIQI
jgi:hypothetical protein